MLRVPLVRYNIEIIDFDKCDEQHILQYKAAGVDYDVRIRNIVHIQRIWVLLFRHGLRYRRDQLLHLPLGMLLDCHRQGSQVWRRNRRRNIETALRPLQRQSL